MATLTMTPTLPPPPATVGRTKLNDHHGLHDSPTQSLSSSFRILKFSSPASSSSSSSSLPSHLTIPFLLTLENVGSIEDLKFKNDKEQLLLYLQSNGVQVSVVVDEGTTAVTSSSSSVSLKDCQEAVKRMVHPSFWRQYASLHPNYSRVKKWLWVHERYRQQIKTITTQKDFEKYHSKIEKHSEFEETQLFRFFLDHKDTIATPVQQDKIEMLRTQHQDLETYDAIQQGFSTNKSSSDDTTKSLKFLLEAYRTELLDHLQLEEETLVGPWLQLTEEEYKEYRTYLSWKYCFMY